MKIKSLRTSVKAGFSLVELLVVIAVIGIMAAIAIPMIGKINESAKVARAKRNAQNAASVYAAAVAAGATFNGTTVGAILTDLQAGRSGAGSFGSTVFKVPSIADIDSQADATEHKVSNYLSYVTTTALLEYNGTNNE